MPALADHPASEINAFTSPASALCDSERSQPRRPRRPLPRSTEASRVDPQCRETQRLDAQRLATQEIAFIDHPEFRRADAQEWLKQQQPESMLRSAVDHSRSAVTPSAGVAFLSAMGQAPLLSPAEERYLFLKMNFLKYRAEQLRRRLSGRRAEPRLCQQIRCDLAEATRVRNRIVESNVRLVVAVARKLSRSLQQLSELTSDGLLPLIRAVELFDIYRGHRFSTYATWAVRNQMHRTLQRQQRLAERITLDDAGVWEVRTEPHPGGEEASDPWSTDSPRLTHWLECLTERERHIVSARFGLNGEPAGQSLTEISGRVGLSKERVRQIVLQSLTKLREAAVADQIEFD